MGPTTLFSNLRGNSVYFPKQALHGAAESLAEPMFDIQMDTVADESTTNVCSCGF